MLEAKDTISLLSAAVADDLESLRVLTFEVTLFAFDEGRNNLETDSEAIKK